MISAALYKNAVLPRYKQINITFVSTHCVASTPVICTTVLIPNIMNYESMLQVRCVKTSRNSTHLESNWLNMLNCSYSHKVSFIMFI